jgi:hypothetical protein
MPSENAANVSHGDGVTERLRVFMDAHNLSLSDLAALLRTPRETIEDWFESGVTPPPCLLALMVLFPMVCPERSKPVAIAKTAPFPSFSSARVPANTQEQEEALRRVRAI